MLVRLALFASLGLVLACGVSSARKPASATPPDAASATTQRTASATGSAAVLHASIADAARRATGVSKMKLRLDATGAFVKQSVYHADAARIAAPVAALAQEKFPGATVVGYETEWYADHGEVHEVEIMTVDQARCEVAAKPDGAELYVECQQSEASLSAAIKQAIVAAFPDGKVLEAEHKTGPGLDEWTIEVQSGDAEYYLILSPDGTVTRKLRRIVAIVEVDVD